MDIARKKRKEKEIKKKKIKGEGSAAKTDPRTPYGEFKNVILSGDDYSKLTERFGKSAVAEMIERMSSYLESAGKKYRSYYAALIRWFANDDKAVKKAPTDQVITKPKAILTAEQLNAMFDDIKDDDI